MNMDRDEDWEYMKSRGFDNYRHIPKDKRRKRSRYADHKSLEKVNKKIRLFARIELAQVTKTNYIDLIQLVHLPIHSNKKSLTWWDCKPMKLKIYRV